MSPPRAVGVDLGTTYTCAAVADDRGARVVQLSGTSQTIPSVVSISGDTVLAGEAAERRLVTHPSDTAREFKRRFGDPAPLVLGGTTYGAEVVTSQLLREVLRRVEQAEGAPPAAVGLAHPASWGPFRLDLLRQSAALAGVEHVELVPEPVAAAVANRARVEEGSLVAVYDLGGGTFDAAVVRCEGDWSVVGTPEGVERLGGVDFDQAIMAHVDAVLDGQVFTLDSSDPEARSALMQLRSECRAAKEHLSQDTDVEIPVSLPNLRTSVRLTRGEFEAMVRPRLADSLSVLDRVVASASASWDDIAQVLLVGGSSNIPAVGQAVSEHTGRPVMTATNPHLAIALGTASVTADRVTPAPPPLPPTAAAPTIEDPAPEAPPGRRLPTGALFGVVAVAAALIVGAILLFGGGDDDSADDPTAPGTAAPATSQPTTSDPATSEPTTSDPATSEAPATSEPTDTTPETEPPTEPPAEPAVDFIVCAPDAGSVSAVTIGETGAMVLLVDQRIVGIEPDAVADCSIDPGSGTPIDLQWTEPVTDLAAGDGRLLLAGPTGGAVAIPGRNEVIPCAPLTGEVEVSTSDRYVALTVDGVSGVQFDDGACPTGVLIPASELTATTVDASRNRLVVGGTDATGAPTVRIRAQQDEVPVVGGDGGPVAFGSVDAVTACGDGSCVFDLTSGVVHQIGDDGVVTSRRPIGGDVGAIAEILDSTSDAGTAYLLARLEGGSTTILRVEL